MPTVEIDRSLPTRERILAAAMRLFSERGYEATSVGEIEAEAGLVPRSGALYRHFPSKRALVEAAIAARVTALEAIERRMELLPLDDVGSELRLIGRLTLTELEGEGELVRLVMKEGDRFPELADAFREAIVDRGHRIGVEWLRERSGALGIELADPDATARALTAALVGYALQRHMLGDRFDAIDRERFLDAWVAIARTVIDKEVGDG